MEITKVGGDGMKNVIGTIIIAVAIVGAAFLMSGRVHNLGFNIESFDGIMYRLNKNNGNEVQYSVVIRPPAGR